ncbi:MAG: hypothetical protein ACR2NY_00910 [Alphaproteobacteria bacterium]
MKEKIMKKKNEKTNWVGRVIFFAITFSLFGSFFGLDNLLMAQIGAGSGVAWGIAKFILTHKII